MILRFIQLILISSLLFTQQQALAFHNCQTSNDKTTPLTAQPGQIIRHQDMNHHSMNHERRSHEIMSENYKAHGNMLHSDMLHSNRLHEMNTGSNSESDCCDDCSCDIYSSQNQSAYINSQKEWLFPGHISKAHMTRHWQLNSYTTQPFRPPHIT